MRCRTLIWTALLAGSPSFVLAQEPASPTPPPAAAGVGISTGWVDFGVRAADVSGDEDRFNRYRDAGSGAVVNRFLWGRATDTGIVRVAASNAGRRDQRFEGSFERTGRFRAAFMWDQIPLRISSDTRSPYQLEEI